MNAAHFTNDRLDTLEDRVSKMQRVSKGERCSKVLEHTVMILIVLLCVSTLMSLAAQNPGAVMAPIERLM